MTFFVILQFQSFYCFSEKKMKKLVISAFFFMILIHKSISQNFITFENNPILNKIYTIDLELYNDSSMQISHFVKLWEIDFQDSLGKYHNHIDLGGSILLPLFKNKLPTKLSLGFGNGNYHSGGGVYRVMENVSFGMDVNYSLMRDINLNLMLYGSIHTFKGNGKRALIDRYLWNYSIIYRLSKILDLGLIFEQYFVTETKPHIKITYSKYLWVGPTATFNLFSDRLNIQSSLGADFIDYIDTGVAESQKEIKEFYKFKIQYSF